jgi:hypothetical protein
VMIEVYDTRGRIDVQDNALHGAHEVIACAKIGCEGDDGIGQSESPLKCFRPNCGNNGAASYSFGKLSEVKCRVKAPCPSRYGVGELSAREIREIYDSPRESAAALTALDVDDILNDDNNGFSLQFPEDDG